MKKLIKLGILAITISSWLSGASADNGVWEKYTKEAAGSLHLQYMDNPFHEDNEPFETYEETAGNSLKQVTCDNGTLMLTYQFTDGWTRTAQIPQGFEFTSREQIKKDLLQFNNRLSYAAFVHERAGMRNKLYANTGVYVYSRGRMRDEINFHVEKEIDNSPRREGWGLPVSRDLMEEMREACRKEANR